MNTGVVYCGLFLLLTPWTTHAYTSQWGTNNYIEYQEGDMPLIITAPHGGSLKPASLPDRRTAGCYDAVTETCTFDYVCAVEDTTNCDAKTLKDLRTKEIALATADELFTLYGQRPHVVICHLHRSKLDANREVNEATFGDAAATVAYNEYHGFINTAKANISEEALLLDIHGQSHSEEWVELGYTISGSRLDSGNFDCEDSTIKSLASIKCPSTNPLCEQECFEDILRGNSSLGKYLMDEYSVQVVPSPANPGPSGGNYYSGGYTVKTHGSETSGVTDAIQVETPSPLRQTDTYQAYSEALAAAVKSYLDEHYFN